jgi:hypothetical protein
VQQRHLQLHRLAGQRTLVQRAYARRHLGGIGEHAVLAQHLGMRQATHALVGCVDVDDAELGITQHQRIGRGVEDGAVLRFAVAQRLLGALAFGDVAAHSQHMRLAGVADRQVAQLDVEDAAVLTHPLRLQQAFAPGQRLMDQRHARADAVFGDARPEALRQHLVAAVAVQALEGAVDVDDAHITVPQHHGIAAAVEGGAVLLLAHAQRRQGGVALGDVAGHR